MSELTLEILGIAGTFAAGMLICGLIAAVFADRRDGGK